MNQNYVKFLEVCRRTGQRDLDIFAPALPTFVVASTMSGSRIVAAAS